MNKELPECFHRKYIHKSNDKVMCLSTKLIGTPGVVPINMCLREFNGQLIPCPYANRPNEEEKYIPNAHGPGTELKKLLSKIGITSQGNCNCDKHMREMNLQGPDWCDNNINIVIGWLRQEAENRGLIFIEYIAKKLVKLAIKRSRKRKNNQKSV